jgi:chromosome segregation protein
MYLKRLELQGFKSFANKTSFEFGPGVTAIVGPNGVGKSNVSEAIRWVLGEPARRSLRVSRTEDIIFTGSARRGPAGLAEVSITLDNTDGWLPLDFSEVVVTRRAFRSGENEYYINRSRVRHRDVQDLFLRAQVGQNSYAFMGQGLVEQVLSLRPEERRTLIEEAADVRLYRAKLDEARDRLAATRENLERVQLLVAEIRPRLAHLEKQATRAALHARLSAELAQLLHVWYAHQWQETTQAVEAARRVRDERQREFEEARLRVTHCEEGLQALRQAIERLRADIQRRERAFRAAEEELRELERRIALEEERRRLLVARRQELSTDLQQITAELASAATSDEAQREAELSTALETARERLEEDRKTLAALEEERSALRRREAELDRQAARERAAAAEARARLDALATESRRIACALEERRSERQALLARLADWAREFRRLRDEALPLSEAIQAGTLDREALERRAQEARARVEELEAEVRRLRSRVESLEIRLEVLGRIDVKPPAPDLGIRTLLAAGGLYSQEGVPDEKIIEGMVGLVGQLVKVQAGFERAIEAALAENLYAVVVERNADALAAIELLLSGDNGRATVIALDSFRAAPAVHIPRERGILGVASQFVRCEAAYRNLVDTLLGRTIVVESLTAGQAVLRRGLGVSPVTIDGVLVRPNGALSAGSSRTVTETLQRQRELDDIPRELARVRPRLLEQEAALRDARRTLQEAEALLVDRVRRLETLHRQQVDAEAALAECRSRLPEYRGRLGLVQGELARLVADQNGLAERGAALDREQAERLRVAEAAGAELEATRARLAEVERDREPLVRRVTEAAGEAARVDGELRSVRQMRSTLESARRRLEAQRDQKLQQLARIAQELESIEQRLATDQRVRSDRSADWEGLRQELDPARRELAQLDSRERSLSQELAHAQAAALTAERALLDAENEVRIRLEELETVRASLEAEGFVAADDGDVRRAAPAALPPGTGRGEDGAEEVPAWLRDEAPETPAGGLPPIRGGAQVDAAQVRERIADLRAQIRALGPVNEQAAADYADSKERYDFLTTQIADLTEAENQLRQAIKELETVIRDRFRGTFKRVNKEFERFFSTFFGGGQASLTLTPSSGNELPGVEIQAQPPGKKITSLALMSGGERSLTAVALLFALLTAHPSPICVLDEVDAALDESNVGRFAAELRRLAERTQFIIITHNRRTIEIADAIYGVSMADDSVSRVLSLRLTDVPRNLN